MEAEKKSKSARVPPNAPKQALIAYAEYKKRMAAQSGTASGPSSHEPAVQTPMAVTGTAQHSADSLGAVVSGFAGIMSLGVGLIDAALTSSITLVKDLTRETEHL